MMKLRMEQKPAPEPTAYRMLAVWKEKARMLKVACRGATGLPAAYLKARGLSEAEATTIAEGL